MVGHGSPQTSSGVCTSSQRMPASHVARLALCALALLVSARWAGAETMRVRIAWGGGTEQTWSGNISVTGQGTLAEPRPLGIEADEPGSMWIDAGRLMIRQRSPRTYDGVDLLVNAPADARLLVQLTSADSPHRPPPIEIPLADIQGGYSDNKLDDHGNRLLVRCTPGDRLRVAFDRKHLLAPHPHLVFTPGERFSFTLEPHALPVKPGSKVRLRIQLRTSRGDDELWSVQHDILAGQSALIPVDANAPNAEGVYEVVITATENTGWAGAVRKPLNWMKTIAERKVQILVLDTRSHTTPMDQPPLSQIVEIDPASAEWWERLVKLPQLPKVPRLWKGPLGNGNMKAVKHLLGELVRLNPNCESPDVSWEAYTLPIKQPNRPHVLEVDFPSDVSQTMGISVVEPNAAGALMPIGLDSGIDTPEPILGGAVPQWQQHRIIFWPRTRTPVVLITNLRDHSPAVYGKIRVLAGWDHLPPAVPAPDPERSGRLLAAYLDRPLFPENFSARERFDAWSGRSLDDWGTFHEGGLRLVEYLKHVGYNGLMMSVVADGSTIYPSKILQATPRYDTGAFFDAANDPVRKDILEMLLRMFDREGLQLIPMIEFGAPLPELEAIRRRGPAEQQAIEWIGPEGKTWRQTNPTQRALAPYYNVLQPKVQEAMLRVVRELAATYGRHPSFAGLAIRLSPNGYAQLPGPQWGMDDATIARFEKDSGLKVPGSGPGRFAERAKFLTGQCRRLWLQWRAAQLSRFYHSVYTELATARADARLYMAGAGILGGADLENALRPTLPRQTSLADALLEVGIDVSHYRDNSNIVLLRPERITTTGSLSSKAIDLEIRQMPDADRSFQSLSIPGSLFFHQPKEVRIKSFDEKSPFQPSYAWLVTQPVPTGRHNRQRFVHSLATLDSQVMIDGGWLLPLGQEAVLRDLVAVYRRLPRTRFHRVGGEAEGNSSQSVTFRYAQHAGDMYLYAVNDSAIPVTAEVRVVAPADCRLKELTGSRKVAPLEQDALGRYWRVKLQPYDLVAVRLSDPGVTLSRPTVRFPAEVEAALKQRIGELGARTASLRAEPPPLDVLDYPSFEQRPLPNDPIPGWITSQRPGVDIQRDPSQYRDGQASARLRSNGPVASLVSRPFEPSGTSRLAVSVWLRVANAGRQPPLRMAIQGMRNNRWDYYRAAPIGANPDGRVVSPISTNWQRFLFPIDDLPLDGLTQLQVRFDLMGAGEVWIDGVELTDLRFSDNEVKELSKLVTLIHVRLQNGQIGDCLRLLEGYWPRFLGQNVPLRPEAVVADKLPPPKPPANKSTEAPPRTGLLNRMRNLLPKPLRF